MLLQKIYSSTLLLCVSIAAPVAAEDLRVVEKFRGVPLEGPVSSYLAKAGEEFPKASDHNLEVYVATDSGKVTFYYDSWKSVVRYDLATDPNRNLVSLAKATTRGSIRPRVPFSKYYYYNGAVKSLVVRSDWKRYYGKTVSPDKDKIDITYLRDASRFETHRFFRETRSFSHNVGNMKLSSRVKNAEVYDVFDDKVLRVEMYLMPGKGDGSVVDVIAGKFGKPISDVVSKRPAKREDAWLAVKTLAHRLIEVESQAPDTIHTVNWNAKTSSGDRLSVVLSVETKSGVIVQQVVGTPGGGFILPFLRPEPERTPYERTFARLSVKNESLDRRLSSEREKLRSSLEEEIRKAIAEGVKRHLAEEKRESVPKPEL